ncbi:MAG: LuxR family transcriptional regulator [Eubacteriales bacterium]
MSYLKMKTKMDQRYLSIVCFFLFFAWILSFPFEGQVLYSLMNRVEIDPSTYVLFAIFAHFLGLFSCGFFIKRQIAAKMMIIISILICISGSLIFFLEFSILWFIALIIMSLFAGFFVSSIGFYIKHYFQSHQRYRAVADVLIYSNILMIIINVISVNVSDIMGLGMSMILLVIALFMAFNLELNPENFNEMVPIFQREEKPLPSILKPFIVLCFFITIITINSGLMYQVVTPAYSHLEVLASYYWAVPYILTLYILRNLPKSINQAYILYIAMAMIGLSYIAFMWLDTSTITSYLIIDTLMLGAFGVCDLFWWSIISNFMDYSNHPAKILGIGLSMNVLGVLIGGFIGNQFLFVEGDNTNASVIALIIIFIVLVMLPILNHQLTKIFNNHMFLVNFSKMKDSEQEKTVLRLQYNDRLTEKEREVVQLLLKGYTYKGIAESLYISQNTMKYHTKNIYQKLHINSKMELIKLYSELEENI